MIIVIPPRRRSVIFIYAVVIHFIPVCHASLLRLLSFNLSHLAFCEYPPLATLCQAAFTLLCRTARHALEDSSPHGGTTASPTHGSGNRPADSGGPSSDDGASLLEKMSICDEGRAGRSWERLPAWKVEGGSGAEGLCTGAEYHAAVTAGIQVRRGDCGDSGETPARCR